MIILYVVTVSRCTDLPLITSCNLIYNVLGFWIHNMFLCLCYIFLYILWFFYVVSVPSMVNGSRGMLGATVAVSSQDSIVIVRGVLYLLNCYIYICYCTCSV